MSIPAIGPVSPLLVPTASEFPGGPTASSRLENLQRGPQSVGPAEPAARPESGSRSEDPLANDRRPKKPAELQETFQQFVGETFFGHLLSAMRKTVNKPAYFHGGRAEEVFQAQLDQTLAERLAQSTAETFSQPLFDLFTLVRSQ